MQGFRWMVWPAAGMVLSVQLAAAGRGAQEGSPDHDVVALFEYCDGETAARIRFIEEALEANRSYARYYYAGWLSFYTLGVGFSSYGAALNERGERAVHILSAIKAVGGIGRTLLWPPSARAGAAASRALPARDDEQCRHRLQLAEQTLRRNARQAGLRWNWWPHLINLAIHVGGAVIVGETWGARRDAWGQAALGETVGEAIIWSFPWQAADTLEEYERRFPASGLPPEPRLRWNLAPQPWGAALSLRF